MCEFSSEFSGDRDSWRDRVNVSALETELRIRVLSKVKEKLGYIQTCEVLGIAKSSLSRYLSGERYIPDDVLKKVLNYLEEYEFVEITTSYDRLKALGVIKENGVVDYSLALQILSIASRDEYLKNALLKFVVENFREDLRKMLGLSLVGIKLTWTEDFERFLRERKKRRKILTDEMIRKYKSYFQKYLEGRELTVELVEEIAKHSIGWVRNIFRHYSQYLYYRRRITPETYGWIIEVVPSRSYKLDVRPYQISLEDVRNTLRFLEKHHKLYYVLYKLMLESGIRFIHALYLLSSWNPGEVVVIESINYEAERLVIFEDKGFCRYYLGLKGTLKPCEWVYMSLETRKLVDSLVPKTISRFSVEKYARKHKLLRPKMMRKVSWRLMTSVMNRDIARFIQSRFGELKVSEARYSDLLTEADKSYPQYLEKLKSVLRAIQI